MRRRGVVERRFAWHGHKKRVFLHPAASSLSVTPYLGAVN